MIRLLHIAPGYTLFAALTMVMLAFPFVHRAGAEPVSPELGRYLAMGGDLLDICGDSGSHKTGGCESCTISAKLLIPASGGPAYPAFVLTFLALEPTASVVALRTSDQPTPPVRAPPRA